MKLTAFLLLVACLQLSAAGYSQKVTLSAKDAPLEQVMQQINKQTGYTFFYNADWLRQAATVTVDLKNADLLEVLDIVFNKQPFTYSIINKTIVLKEKEKPMNTPPPADITSIPASIHVEGKVVDEKGNGLGAATIKVKGTSQTISASGNGGFTIVIQNNEAILQVSYIGYKTKEVTVSGADVILTIKLEIEVTSLSGVSVSTGYQEIPRELATGSFEKIDNELLNRITGPSVIARLDGIVPGVFFNKRISRTPDINFMNIRGLSTLISNAAPLVILDNFPYEGNVNNINPNDIESVTILKDAAAASIWGARASNGVVVLTSKKAQFNKPLQISLTSNVTISEKPDLFYSPQINTSEYIDVEKFLFSKGFFDSKIANVTTRPYLTPVVELMAQARAGTIPQAVADMRIDSLRAYDIRNDYLKYVNRNQVAQQYALSISGGNAIANYLISGGYDRNTADVIRTNSDRITFRTAIAIKPIRNLDIHVSSFYTQTNSNSPGLDLSNTLKYSPTSVPYLRLADDNGNPMVLGRDYRTSFIDTLTNNRLVDWHFRPLSELDASSRKSTASDILINLNAQYRFSKVISAAIRYQYEKNIGETKEWMGPQSYFTRNLYNLYTQPVGSAVEHPVPAGGILDALHTDFKSQSYRVQLNFDKRWGSKHQLTAIAGAEARDNHTTRDNSRVYGYNKDLLTYANVNYLTQYLFYLPLNISSVPSSLAYEEGRSRFTSVFINTGYTFANRYTLTASVRKDASNLFGVETNQRGVPLWSVGTGWEISKETFYKSDFLPYLKLRASYGYSGNTNSALSAYSTISYRGAAFYTNMPWALINSPANEELRWEKTGIANFGLDLGFKNNRVKATIEYYIKNAKDLLYGYPIGYTTGFSTATINATEMRSNGIDLSIYTNNLNGKVKWETAFIFSYLTNKVTKFSPLGISSASEYLGAHNVVLPIVGKPLYAMYAYKWGGLDGTGNPQGYLNGQLSTNYPSLNNVPADSLQYFGSAIPLCFGALRNTITWKKFSLSANIVYKFKYYFKRPTINYGALFSNRTGHSDYSLRWQKPGDESRTDVPAMIYPNNSNRDVFYQGSAAVVTKGDHIRLQDITMSYQVDKAWKFIENMKLFVNINNLVILWRANNKGIDPDYQSSYPAQRSVSIGLNASF